MSQIIRPTSDISTGAFTTTPLWSKLDDNSDADYVTSDIVVGDSFRCHLANPANDPLVSTGHILRARWRRAGGTTAGGKLRLYQGSTLIATLTNSSLGGSFATSSLTLTGSQADSITDYNDLRADVEFYAGTGLAPSIDVAWVELEIPDLTAPDAPTGISAEDGNPSRVRVTYTPGARAVDNNIYRNTSNSWSGATKIYDGDLASPYDDTPTAGIQYWYGVRSSNDAGESPNSSLNSGYRLAVPAAPTGIAASKGTYADHVHVQATDASGAFDGADSFKAYRNTVNDSGTATLIASGLSTPSYDDYTVVAGTTYYWWFKGHNDAGDGPFSTTDTGYAASAFEGTGAATVATAASGSGSTGTAWGGAGSATLDTYAEGLGDVGAGGLYGRLDRFAWGYVWDHRPATLKIAVMRDRELLAGPRTVLVAETTGIRHDSNTLMAVGLGDLTRRLDVAAQRIALKGTGGIEGSAEVAGKRAPLCFGKARNVKGVRLSPVEQKWLVHRDEWGLQITSVDGVYAGQNPVSSSQYDVIFEEGSNIVEITGTDVLDGTEVTFDVTGPLIGADAGLVTLAELVKWLAYRDAATSSGIGVLSEAEVNTDRFALFDLRVPFGVGCYVDSEITIADLLDDLLSPFAWWGMDSGGLLDIGLNVPPLFEPPDYTLERGQVLDARILKTVSPAKQITTGYDRNPTVLSQDQVVGAAAGTARALWAVTPYRSLTTTNGSWSATYPTARTPEPYVTPFTEQADAEVVHGWIAGALAVPMRFYRVVASLAAVTFEPGRVVELSWPRWGMDTADSYRIAGVSLLPDWTVELTLWRVSTRYVLGSELSNSYLTDERGAPLGM